MKVFSSVVVAMVMMNLPLCLHPLGGEAKSPPQNTGVTSRTHKYQEKHDGDHINGVATDGSLRGAVDYGHFGFGCRGKRQHM